MHSEVIDLVIHADRLNVGVRMLGHLGALPVATHVCDRPGQAAGLPFNVAGPRACCRAPSAGPVGAWRSFNDLVGAGV
jgi:hypothetical protein